MLILPLLLLPSVSNPILTTLNASLPYCLDTSLLSDVSVSHAAHTHSDGHAAHGHAHDHDFVEANKAYFNEHAHEYGDVHPEARETARLQIDAMRAEWPGMFDKERTIVMDFACGVGLISEQLVPHVKRVVGVDISQASVNRYNARAAEQLRLTPETMKAVAVELKGEPGELDGTKFDLVVCAASFHHFPSIEDMSRLLASFLKPGGALVVADIKAAPDGRPLFPETHHHLVPHRHGISEAHLRGAFEGAGLGAFELKDAATLELPNVLKEAHTTWFVARGVKPQ